VPGSAFARHLAIARRRTGSAGAATTIDADAAHVALTRWVGVAIPRAFREILWRIRPVSHRISRRAFARASVLTLGSFAILHHARGDAPLELRCSLDTAPSHPRNVAFRDFLGKFEAASGGQVKTKLFESGSLFPDLQVLKALLQGQVEMACPGTW